MGELVHLHTRQEPWISKRTLAAALGVSKRYVEYKTAAGMPSRMFAGKRQYRLSASLRWLEENGHIEKEGA